MAKPYFQLLCPLFSECENLITKMLQVDPDRRLSIERIMQHKWITQVLVLYIFFSFFFQGKYIIIFPFSSCITNRMADRKLIDLFSHFLNGFQESLDPRIDEVLQHYNTPESDNPPPDNAQVIEHMTHNIPSLDREKILQVSFVVLCFYFFPYGILVSFRYIWNVCSVVL